MQSYVLNCPDRGAVAEVLKENRYNAVGVILRLAWQAGLMREEIASLTWPQLELSDRRLALPDRQVPLTEELVSYFTLLGELRGRTEGPVVLSDRDGVPLTPQSISRLARRALDSAGQGEIRLVDLRHDFVLSELERHDWQYVSRVCGIDLPTLRAHFASYLPDRKVSARRTAAPAPLDEVQLWRLVQAEGASPVGVTLWLTWQMGLRLREIVSLRWEQLDLRCAVMVLPRGRFLVPPALGALLRRLRPSPAEGPVLVTPQARSGFDPDRLSKLTRGRLVQGGLDDLSLRDLRLDWELRAGGEAQVRAYIAASGPITRNALVSLLKVSPSTAHLRLKNLVRRGKLVQVGMKYYLPGTVVPPERQASEIRAYLAREGFAYRQDIARLLRVEVGQCYPILRRLVASGELVQVHQKYYLKEA